MSNLKLRSVSDLMITRIRQLLDLPYIGSDNTPPGSINDALLHGNPGIFIVSFSLNPSKEVERQHSAAGLCMQMRELHSTAWDPVDQATWDRVCPSVDSAVRDFNKLDFPNSHISRLVFQFNFGNSHLVSRDIRLVFLAPILDRYDGTLTYPSYSHWPEIWQVKPDQNNLHPEGIEVAWEGEYVFARPVPLEELQRRFEESYDTKLRLTWPTPLPERKIDGVSCRCQITTRFF